MTECRCGTGSYCHKHLRYGTRGYDHYGNPIRMSQMELRVLRTNAVMRRRMAKKGLPLDDR